jgi:membrane protease subunit (stomatin/prohibitin family)
MAFDVVELLDPTGEMMVGRIPQEGSGDFLTGSQLVVQENQVAVFYRDGRATDQFRAGRRTLSTENLPILASISRLAFGGHVPFRAYVYFVNLKVFTDMRWGTPNPILFRDSEFGLVNLGARGTSAIRIIDHTRFLNTIVGTQGLQTTPKIKDYLRQIIASRFATVLPEVQTTVADLPQQYPNLSARMKAALTDDFSQYGLELVDLIVENVTLPSEVQVAIDRVAGTRAVRDDEVAKFQQVQTMSALRDAAVTGGEGGMAAGVGLGAGLALAKQLLDQQAENAPVPPPLPPTPQWYVAIAGEPAGPMTYDDLRTAVQSGQIAKENLVWRSGMASWAQAGEASELAALFSSGPPPIPPG